MQVADDRVRGTGHHRGVAIRVDGEDRLGRSTADDVLDGPADAAGDVQVGGDPRPGLPDLLGVRSPAGGRHHAGNPDRAAEERGQLIQLGEPLGASDTATAADDDAGIGERDLAGFGWDMRRHPDPEIAIGELRLERLDRDRGTRAAGVA